MSGIVARQRGGIKVRSSTRYNCYGYALNMEEWLVLDNFRYSHTEEEKRNVLTDCTIELLRTWSNFNIEIESDPFKKLPDNRYMIAFRIANGDFHFAKRAKNNHWYHKQGSFDIAPISIQKLLDCAWYSSIRKYDSKIVFFSLDAH